MPNETRDRFASAVERAIGAVAPPLRDRLPRRPPARPIGKVIFTFARHHPDAFFVQVGAHDGTQLDPLQDEITHRRWHGIMVEPVPYVFERLRASYGDDPRLILENVAIADVDGEREFHHLRQADTDDGEVWKWYDALGSFRREVVLSHRELIPDIEDRIVTTNVPCLTFDSLCGRHGVTSIDVIQTDTEGYDYEVLRRIDLDRYRPKLVMFENLHLDAATRQASLELLEAHGYEHTSDGMDTLGVHRDALERLPDLARLWRTIPTEQVEVRATPAVPLTRRVRGLARRGINRVLASGGFELSRIPEPEDKELVDRSVPLPEGAEERLRSDHPRLLELCAAYDALDWPVVTHSRWKPEFYESWLDLRYFRGDNAYIWHYREGDELSRLRFFVYLTYVEGLDGGEVLSRLTEDGAFGCFTYDFAGHPRCSRDLLDSACELSFLDRHLSILDASRLRALDIGAGYGRLAHRTSAACKDLADYCCVDAVPHSTFVSEYYLEARQLQPTARVVALPDVPTLVPGSFDVALNVHSFSECTRDAVRWWLEHLVRLDVPHLFLVPNEPEGFLSLETDGRRLDLLPSLEEAGYHLVAEEPAILDDSVRDLLGLHDRHCLFARAR